jgi:UDP-N-acetylglucosamine 3-dehydrogenase
MKPVRFAIIGFEHMHAFSYAHSLHRIAGAQLVAAAEAGPELLERIKRDFPHIPAFHADYREMLDKHEIDAVVITTANARHHEVALECARRKKHILCEKPLATRVTDAVEMIGAARANGIKLMTAFPVRFSPAIVEARKAIRSGALGRILGASTSNHGSMPGGFFIEREKSGGGAVIDHTVHVVDLLRWLFEDEVEEVYAEYATRLHDIKVEDVGQLMLKFRNGAVVSLDTSWSRPKSYSTWGDVKLEIKGERANLSLNCFPRTVNVFCDQTMRHSGASVGEDLDQMMIEEFLSSVREDREPCVSGEDGMRAMEVALAAYAAGESGKNVKLELAGA